MEKSILKKPPSTFAGDKPDIYIAEGGDAVLGSEGDAKSLLKDGCEFAVLGSPAGLARLIEAGQPGWDTFVTTPSPPYRGAIRFPAGAADAIGKLIQSPLFVDKSRLRRLETYPDALPPRALICIPAQREQAYIGRAIESVARAARASPIDCGIVVVVNNCDDGTFEEAELYLANATPEIAGAVADISLDPPLAGIGFARRFAFDLAAAFDHVEFILSTDADTLVGTDWIEQACTVLSRADLVCGQIEVDPSEIASLPDSVARSGLAEVALERASNRLWCAVFGPRARGFNNKGAGANMAVRAYAYRASGGLPPLSSSEDRALHSLFERQGRAIAHCQEMKVLTSCRLEERTPYGMASCLKERAQTSDPLLDAELVPAKQLLLRFVLQQYLLQPITPQHVTTQLALLLSMSAAALEDQRYTAIPLVWPEASIRFPELTGKRLRTSEAATETNQLNVWADRIEQGADPWELVQPGNGRELAEDRIAALV